MNKTGGYIVSGVTMILTPLVGLLVITGKLNPGCSDQVVNLLVGGGITIFSILIGSLHHIEASKISTQTVVVPPVSQAAGIPPVS